MQKYYLMGDAVIITCEAYFEGLQNIFDILNRMSKIYTHYWCIDGRYISYVARLRNGGKTSV